jgi:uncharacterized protein (TIGR02271 family)
MAVTTCTVVGVFKNHETAQRVAAELAESGFSRNDFFISERDVSDAALGNTGLSPQSPRDTSGGGISGFFHRLFGSGDVDEETRGHYAEAVRSGRAVVTVHTDESRQDQVRDIMERYDPVNVGGQSGAEPVEETRNRDTLVREERADLAERLPRGMARTGEQEQSIPVLREELEVGKRNVLRGGVRVYSRVSQQPVEESVNLREEHVRVDRRPADRPATEADFRSGEQVIEVTEMAEEPVIGKRTRVVEEVVVGKDVTERTETVRDRVRQSEVNVDRIGAGTKDDAGAASYASELANDERYRGKRWDEIEPDVRRDYERRYPGSAWQETKDAIRHGWERITGQR